MCPVRQQGRFRATSSRFGFIRPAAGSSDDFFVPIRAAGGALDGDLVLFEPLPGAFGASTEARIVAILERGHQRLTGVVAGTRRQPYVAPDPPRLPSRMRIIGGLGKALPADRVLGELVEGQDLAMPGMRILERLGDAGDPALDAEIVTTEFGLASAYPAEALAEAERVGASLATRDWQTRRDFSQELTFTIDPADAQDHDDAVAIAPDPAGGWRLRVHIADVAEAVAPGGVIDREALRRGNSTYLPGRMIPMLPELFARDLMSLRPTQRRPVITLSMRLQSDGQLLATRVEEGLILSRAALDYDTVQSVLEGRGAITPEIDAALHTMHALARRLRARRFTRGGFDLAVPERVVVLDDEGWPVEIRRRVAIPSYEIIEEFMILANRVACAFALRRGQPYLFRVHDEPDPRAVERFRSQVRCFAPEAPLAQLRDWRGLRSWLAGLQPGARTWQIHALFLRSMRRAVYAPVDRGHFGLGLRGYAHFTSPIRRYPDLFNHRIVKWALHHGETRAPFANDDVGGAIAIACTETEDRSERAEQALVRIKSVRWAERHMGEEFHGRVVAVTPAGAFVEFDATPVEGLVPAEDFPGQARRPRRRRRARERELLITPDLGMAVIVRIARVDHRARRILLGLVTSGPRSRERDLDRLNDSGLDQAGGARTGDRRKSRKHLQYREPAPHRRGGGRTSHRRRGSGR